jgi:hypothetical protein
MSTVVLPAHTLAASPFPVDYFEARERFRSAVEQADGAWESVPVQPRGPLGEELTIDIARLGPETARRLLVLSSGLHGVEGFFGSAAQLHWLTHSPRQRQLPKDVAVLLLHALNPFGFAWLRRANEQNVDLNRNFLLDGETYIGSPPLYGHIYRIFDPTARPNKHTTPLLLRSMLAVWRHGMKQLRGNLPVGQHDYPSGLFFGGKGPAETQDLLRRHLPTWINHADAVLHLDFHTGLGLWGEQKLLLDRHSAEEADWWVRHFGKDTVELSDLTFTSYPTRGSFGPWVKAICAPRRYLYAAAEYGTYPSLRVITALLTETRGFHHGLGNPRYTWTRELLREMFAPASPLWRQRVVRQATAVVEHGLSLLAGM